MSCSECGRSETHFPRPRGWNHHSLRGERVAMWPDLCPSCGLKRPAVLDQGQTANSVGHAFAGAIIMGPPVSCSAPSLRTLYQMARTSEREVIVNDKKTGGDHIREAYEEIEAMDEQTKQVLKKGARIRIITRSESFSQRPKGQDTQVQLVLEDGTTMPLKDPVSATFRVDSRSNYTEACVRVHGAEIEAEATLQDEVEHLKHDLAIEKRRADELGKELARRIAREGL